MAKTSVILQKSLDEIKAGGWICGDLCVLPKEWSQTLGGYVATASKPMACAVGLISLNAGGKAVNKERVTIRLKSGKKSVKLMNFATYPNEVAEEGDNWPKNAIRALELLVLTAPRGYMNDLFYKQIKGGNTPKRPNYKTSTDTEEYEWNEYLRHLSDAVVNINDSVISGRKQSAKAWFERALKLAEKEESNGQNG